MNDYVSPYALLCASKPQSAPTMTTAYDLYCAASACSTPVKSRPECAPVSLPQHTAAQQHNTRTHYIEEIRRRHCAAISGCMGRKTGR